MIVIRTMTADDLDRVLSIETPTPEAPHWDRTAYESFLRPPDTEDVRHAAWVAMDAEQLKGFAAARLVFDVCELESILVVENARRKGLGKALISTVSNWALTHGAVKIELEVRAGNENAICFYEKAGLRREGLRSGYYRRPDEDAVLMGKTLE
ncbi:MAG TPA: GNAT family N-acetyltransferase [Silvibacterium sp.]|jgi:ribosomal-protein-alanine N-acetyltransferase|nr:GNAT family N-acetyltransferase [Silvibacterium sp.]